MSEQRPDTEKIRPYEHLSDSELWQLSGEAADYRLRLALSRPREVRETLVAHGCPPQVAARLLANPQMRAHAGRFHLDAADALLGDSEARERVEHVQEGWQRLRERQAPQSAPEALAEAELDERYGR